MSVSDVTTNLPKIDYKTFKIRKKNGFRYIQAPSDSLKEYQSNLIPFLKEWPLHPNCAGVDERSIFFNASFHKNKKHILKIDLKDAFFSTKEQGILNVILQSQMKNSWKHKFIDNLDFMLYGESRFLPTGAPTSPMLLSIVLTEADYWLETILPSHMVFSRYIDDITISTNEDISWDNKKSLMEQISKYFFERGFRISKSKTRWYKTGHSSSIVVTGVNVNNGGFVPKAFKDILRVELDKQAKISPELTKELEGKLQYIHSISKNEYSYFKKYFEKRKTRYFS